MIFIKEHILAAKIHHDNLILYLSPNPPLGKSLFEIKQIIEDGIKTIRVYVKPIQTHWLRRLMVYVALLAALIYVLFQGFIPNIVHLHIFSEARFALFTARLFRIPTVVTEHWSALCRPGILSEARLKKARWVYENSALVLPVCDHLRRCIERNTGARFDYRIIFNALDDSIFYYDNSQEQIRSDTDFQIISVARLEEIKNIPNLLQGVANLRNERIPVHLHLVGDGHERQAYERLAVELGLKDTVIFYGHKPKTEIAHMMREADIFVLASNWENSPCVIGEALSCGLPVVATSVGGVSELVSHDDGVLVPPSDPQALAEAIKFVLKNYHNYDSEFISRRAHARFSYEAVGNQLDQIYRRLAASHSSEYYAKEN